MARASLWLGGTLAIGILALGSPVAAQEGSDADPGYAEQIYVYGPHPAPERSGIGAPVGDVSLSHTVRYDDLDLSTPWGARELRYRIQRTADRLCRQLNQFYPTSFYPTYNDSRDCNQEAIRDAMAQADVAIARARSYAD